jgi:predicted nuclease of predicted toxin-antitoxin system
MKFLIDAQLPPRLCDWLRERGHEARHVADMGLLAASDAAIADTAQREEMILVTKDEDFIYLRLPDRFAMLWLRIGNATNRALADWLSARWPAIEAMLAAGERLVEVR